MKEEYIILTVCVLLLIAIIVGLDVTFFRGHFFERLIANIGIVLLFGAFYLRFLR